MAKRPPEITAAVVVVGMILDNLAQIAGCPKPRVRIEPWYDRTLVWGQIKCLKGGKTTSNYLNRLWVYAEATAGVGNQPEIFLGFGYDSNVEFPISEQKAAELIGIWVRKD